MIAKLDNLDSPKKNTPIPFVVSFLWYRSIFLPETNLISDGGHNSNLSGLFNSVYTLPLDFRDCINVGLGLLINQRFYYLWNHLLAFEQLILFFFFSTRFQLSSTKLFFQFFFTNIFVMYNLFSHEITALSDGLGSGHSLVLRILMPLMFILAVV